MTKGKLIGIEGLNGVGKTSLIERLKGEFPDFVYVREPGQTETGQKIREILLDRNEKINPLSEFLLFCADRVQTYQQVVKPALDSGKTVISDRTYLSSLAFQGALSLEQDKMLNIHQLLDVSKYDLIVVLTADLDTIKSRMKVRQKLDSIESRSDQYMIEVQNIFLKYSDFNIKTTNLNENDVYRRFKFILSDYI